MFDELYSQGDSFFHQADPRIKIVAATSLIVVLAVSRQWQTGLFGLLLGLGLLTLIRLPFRQVTHRLLLVNGFILFLWLVLPWSTPGTPLPALQSLPLTREGVDLALLITLKSNAILLLFFALLATSNVAALGRALESLGAPSKLAYLLLFCYRYLFVLHQEFQRLNRAARLRCFRPSNRLLTYRTLGNLVGMTLVKSWERSERVGQSMRMRGFSGRLHSLHPFTIRPTDWALLGLLLLCAAALVLVEGSQG